MPRPSTLPVLLALFRTYLEELDVDWKASGGGALTLPDTRDGKVNVRQLAARFKAWADDRRPMLETVDRPDVVVPASTWQYIHNDQAWRDDVNLLAKEQGLKPVGSRGRSDAGDRPDVVQARMSRLAREAKVQGEGHAVSRAVVGRLERELAESQAEVRRWKARFGHLQATGGVIRVDDVEG